MRPSRYYLEYEDQEKKDHAKKLARASGADVDSNNDWYEPPDFIRSVPAGDNMLDAVKAMRKLAKTLDNTVSLYERKNIHVDDDLVDACGSPDNVPSHLWDYESEFVEDYTP